MRAVFVLLLMVAFNAAAIVIRHDVPDSEYLAESDALPALATLYSDGAHGTLVHARWVLTAAHATFCINPGSEIRIGDSLATVARVFVHKDYSPGSSHDIALIELQEPVTGMTPLTLYSGSDEVGKDLWFIGMGGTGDGVSGQVIDNAENRGQLRAAQNKVSGADGPLLRFLFDRGGQALPREGVSGSGDSGGPAYAFENGTGHLYGISSRVEKGRIGAYGVTEVYTRVSFFRPWIEQVISGENVEDVSFSKLQTLPAGLTEESLPAVCAEIGL